MISFFCASAERALATSRLLSSVTAEIDGPFRLHRGRLRGNDAAVWEAPGGADVAYSAARLAARRGTVIMVPVLECVTGIRLAEEQSLSLAEVYPIGSIFDGTKTEDCFRLLSDSAREFPFVVEDHFPKVPCWESTDPTLPPLMTLPVMLANGALARRLHGHSGAVLFDQQGSGYADAARDVQCTLQPLANLSALLSARAVIRPVALQESKAYDEMMAAFAESLG